MILVWYNPKLDKYYQRTVIGLYKNYYLDMTNSYGHILVQIFLIENNSLISIKNVEIHDKETFLKCYHEKKLNKGLKNEIFHFLNRLKK